MIEKKFDGIKKEDIEGLLQRQVREKRTLEYKQALPNDSDDQKREFLADVSSFANASGGDLLYGISEDDGIPKEVVGIQGNLDAEVLRLENIVRTSLSPRIPSVQIKPVAGFANGGVILMRIGKSWAAPHMITFKNLSRFFTRSSAGKYQMDVSELRTAFLLSDSIAEKIKQFRIDRITKIATDDTPMPLESKARVILHLLPVSAFSSNTLLDMGALYASEAYMAPMYVSGYNRRINLDGLLSYSEKRTYCQIYRNGQIEAVASNFLHAGEEGQMIPSVYYEAIIVQRVVSYIKLLQSMQISGPFVIAVSMLGVKGAKMALGPGYFSSNVTGIDRDVLILPDVLIEDTETPLSNDTVAKMLRPAFDVAWNACGFVQSLNYNENGDWKHKWQ